MSILHDIHASGQSIWYDYISRGFLYSGEMERLVTGGLRGMTSNPTIFEGAIASGTDYDAQIAELDAAGASTADIATALFVSDVRQACDIIRDVHTESNGTDGFISLEVAPTLAHDTEGTIAEARRLWAAVDRPNLMIKIPATPAGWPAIQACIADGINVNVTLIFSIEQYRHVADAYIGGLEKRRADGNPIDNVHSVASVFVSRIDAMIDERLEAIGTDKALALRGEAALANAKLVYRAFRDIFSDPRWAVLAADGAHVQRPLWASTSTKNASYPDLIYVDNLIGPDTVNTVPPATLTAILDHGKADATIDDGAVEAERTIERIEEVGVSIAEVMERLLTEGVDKFVASFTALFEKIEAKRDALRLSSLPQS